MKQDWIRHLAADIADRFNRPQAERMVEDVIREAVRDNAPDAESLAVALENCITALKPYKYQPGFSGMPEYALVTAVAALKHHRAAHPAQVSTEVVLGNK